MVSVYFTITHTLLIQNKHITTIQVDGVGGTETGHCGQKTWSAKLEAENAGKSTSAYIHHRRRLL